MMMVFLPASSRQQQVHSCQACMGVLLTANTDGRGLPANQAAAIDSDHQLIDAKVW